MLEQIEKVQLFFKYFCTINFFLQDIKRILKNYLYFISTIFFYIIFQQSEIKNKKKEIYVSTVNL